MRLKIIILLFILLLFRSISFSEKLIIVSGNNKVLKGGENIPLVVKLVDEQGKPIQGAKIEFLLETVPLSADDTSLSDSVAETDKQGEASVTFSVGTKPGQYRVSAQSRKNSVIFSIKVTEKPTDIQVSSEKKKMWPIVPENENIVVPLPPIDEQIEQIKTEKVIKVKTKDSEVSQKEKTQEKQSIEKPVVVKEKKDKTQKEKSKISPKKEIAPIAPKDKKEEIPEKEKTTIKFFIVAGSPAKITTKIQNTTLIANGEEKTLICSEVFDKYENIVADDTIVSFSADTGNIITPDMDLKKEGTQIKTKQGIACVTYRSATQTGTAKITIQSANIIDEREIELLPGPLASLVISPEKLTISAGETKNFSVSGFDKFNNLIAELKLQFSVVGNIGDVSDDGKFTAKYSGEGKLQVSCSGIKTEAKVIVKPGIPEKILLLSYPKKVEVKKTIKIAGKVVDKFGNSIPDIPVRYEIEKGGASLQNYAFTTDATGKFYIDVSTSEKIEEQVIRVSAKDIPSQDVRFVSIPSSPNIIKLSSDSEILIANGKDTANVTSSVFDKYGNPVSDGTLITFFAEGGSIIAKDVDASSQGVQVPTKDGKVNVLFKAGTRAKPSSVTSSVDNIKEKISFLLVPDKPKKLVIKTQQDEILVGGGETIFCNVSGFDAFENKIGEGIPITVNLSDGEIVGEDRDPKLEGVQLYTGKDGEVNFGIKSSKKAQKVFLRAQFENIAAQKILSYIPKELSKIIIFPKEAKITAGESAQFEAKGFDIYDNSVNIIPNFEITGVGKINKNTGLFVSTKAGISKVSATSGNITGFAKVQVDPSLPVEIKITSEAQELVVGESIPITASVYDVYGNPVPNIEVEFICKTKDAKLSINKGKTGEDGTLTTILTLPTKVQEIIIEAISPQIKKKEKKEKQGFYQNKKILFAYRDMYIFDIPTFIGEDVERSSSIKIKTIPKGPGEIEIISIPEIIADGLSEGEIKIKVLDEYKNIVSDGTIVTFSADRGKITTKDLFLKEEGCQVRTKDGIAKILFKGDIRAGPVNISIRAGPLQKNIIVNLIPEVRGISILPSTSKVVADGKSLIKLDVLFYDRDGNVVLLDGIQAQIKTKLSKILQPQDIIPEKEGVQFKIVSSKTEILLEAPTIAGEDIVSIFCQKISNYINISFIPGELSKITIYPNHLTISAGKNYKFRAECADKFGNIISECDVFWKTIGEGCIIFTDGSFSCNTAGSAKVIAYSNNIFGFADVVVVSDKPEKLNLSSSSDVVFVGEKVIISLILKDKYDNFVKNYKLFCKTSTEGAVILQDEVTTDNEGKASFEFIASQIAGVNNITVSSKDVSSSISILGRPLAPAKIQLFSYPETYTPNSTLFISAKVSDIYNNLVDKTHITFTTTGGLFKNRNTIVSSETIAGVAKTELQITSPPKEIIITASCENGISSQLILNPSISIPISREELPPPLYKEEKGKIIDRLTFKDADIRLVLAALSEKGEINIVADEKVTGTVSLSLVNIPVMEGLELILKTKGYGYRKIGESIIVYSQEMAKEVPVTEVIRIRSADASEVKELVKDFVKDGIIQVDKRTNSLIISSSASSVDEIKKTILAIDYPIEGVESPGGVATSIIRLEYAEASTITGILMNMGFGRAPGTSIQTYLQSSGMSSAAGNVLIIRETPENLARIKKVIQEVDKPPMQVRIELRLEEINSDATKDLGIKWTEALQTTYQERPQVGGNRVFELQPITRSTISVTSLLSTLQSQGKAKTLSSPSIATVDGREARIFLGKKIPYFPKVTSGQTIQVGVAPAGTTAGVSTVVEPQFKDAGITMSITPRIDKEGQVSVQIRIDVSSLVGIIQDVPMIETKTAETFIRIKDGETIVIGGLISNDEIERQSKFPILADAPILGNLFRSKRKENKQTELVIFVTPYIIK